MDIEGAVRLATEVARDVPRIEGFQTPWVSAFVIDLQLALIALAAAVLLGLYLNARWQERRLIQRMRERLHGGVSDPLHGEVAPDPLLVEGQAAVGSLRARRDPTFSAAAGAPGLGAQGGSGAAAWSGAGGPGGSANWNGPAGEGGRPPQESEATGNGEVVSEELPTPAALLKPDWAEDPLIDCSLEIRCARAVDGVSVIDAAASLLRSEWKLPVHFVVWDARHQQWVLPDRFGYYNDALASIQLAGRHGRLDEQELARFVGAVQELARALDADVDAPDAPRVLEQAVALDALCARFDIRINLTVECAGAAWTGPQLRNAAQEAGFVATSGHDWVRYDARGDVLYTLQVGPEHPDRVSLEFDIATAPIEAHGLRAMVAGAQALAAALGGQVVDDNGTVIDERSVRAIEVQLERVLEEMCAADIVPGSARARRLYH